MSLVSKICATCGREIEWRKKWEKCWDEIRYCSNACKKKKPKDLDGRIEREILDLLNKRAGGATICPSEVARSVFPEDQWREEMERVRHAARRLVAKGGLEFLQKSQVIDPSTAKGPIRLRKK